MKRSVLFNKVTNIISAQFGWDVEAIGKSTTFDDLCADNSDLDQVALSIDDEFEVDVFNKMHMFHTVGDLVDYIEENIKE